MANVRTFDFKSVGIKTTATAQPKPSDNRPIGIKTPLRLGQSSDGIFEMNFNLGDQIKDNLKNMILTNHGERVGLYDFGGNLRELTLELGTDVLDSEVLVRINTTVSKYMPFVSLSRLERSIDNDDNEDVAKINMRIFYSVPALRITDQAVDVRLFIGG